MAINTISLNVHFQHETPEKLNEVRNPSLKVFFKKFS